MKSNLYLDERPLQEQSKRLLKGHAPPLKTATTTLNYSTSVSQAAQLLRRLDQLSEAGEYLYRSPISRPPNQKLLPIPRYVFLGDQPGESEIRLGIFGGIEGPNHAGSRAIAEFIADLVAFPSLGSAFRIYAYPIVNQGGLEIPAKQPDRRLPEENRRHLKPGEASILERELFVVQFQGLIVVQTIEENEGLRVTVDNPNLHNVLVLPIVEALRSLFPTTSYSDFNLSLVDCR